MKKSWSLLTLVLVFLGTLCALVGCSTLQSMDADIPTEEYVITLQETEGGSIGAFINDKEQTKARAGDNVRIVLKPEEGYSYAQGTLKVNGKESGFAFRMPAENVTVTASFVKGLHSITVDDYAGGTIVPSKTQAAYGEAFTVTVTPNEDYRISKGSFMMNATILERDEILEEKSYELVMPDCDITLSANFISRYNITMSGKGLENDPWLVEDAADMEEIAACVRAGEFENTVRYFKVQNNITLPATFTGIGVATGDEKKPDECVKNAFNGVFDGNNKTITVSLSGDNFVGLFVVNKGTVKNLTVEGTVAVAKKNGAAIVAYNVGGTVQDCVNKANVTGAASSYHVGGVVGFMWGGNLKSSNNEGAVNVTGGHTTGGVVGYIGNASTVDGCENKGAVTAQYEVGGVVGYVGTRGVGEEGAEVQNAVKNCKNRGTVTGLASNTNSAGMGGVIGRMETNNYAEGCENYNTVTGQAIVGGVIGRADSNNAEKVVVKNCKNFGSVTGTGGMIGGVLAVLTEGDFGGIVEGCENSGAVSGANDMGGVIGRCKGNIIIKSAKNSGSVTGTGDHVGGVIGLTNQSTATGTQTSVVENSENSGDIVGGTSNIGGIVGCGNGGLQITNCKNSGDISNTTANKNNWSMIGGIVGSTSAGYTTVKTTISGCENRGNMTGLGTFIGGLTGLLRAPDDSEIVNCKNFGNITSTATTDAGGEGIGGIVGVLRAKLTNCYCWTDAVIANHKNPSGVRADTLKQNGGPKGPGGFLFGTQSNGIFTGCGLCDEDGEPIVEYAIKIGDHENGNITFTVNGASGKTSARKGDAIVATCTADAGYTYQENSFKVNGTASELTFTMPAEEVTLSATFDKVAGEYRITIKEGTGGGTMTYTVADGEQSETAREGQSITVTMHPAGGYVYKDQSFKVNGEGSELTFNMPGHDIELSAEFVPETTEKGSGTLEDPYRIESAEDFKTFAENINAGKYAETVVYFKLTTEITLEGATAVPVGVVDGDGNTLTHIFKGVFDGNNQSITVTLTEGTDYTALFRGLGKTGVIKNLTVKGTVSATGHNIAAIVGHNEGGTIEGCVNEATVTATGASYHVGGIVGLSSGGTLTNCTNKGNITASEGHTAGGVAGKIENGVTMDGCINGAQSEEVAAVTGKYEIGGVVGYVGSHGATNETKNTVKGCKNYAHITSTASKTSSAGMGGVMGRMDDLNYAEGCENYGAVNGQAIVGGVVGRVDSLTNNVVLKNCKNHGAVTGSEDMVGGVCGVLTCPNTGSNGTFEGCENEGVVQGTSNVGGIVGKCHTGITLKGCKNSGAITATGAGTTLVGGIIGATTDNKEAQSAATTVVVIEDCENRGDVTGQDQYVGGIVGLLRAPNTSEIKNCKNFGNIKSNRATGAFVGGIVGGNRGKVTGCYCLETATVGFGSGDPTAASTLEEKGSGSSGTSAGYISGGDIGTIEGCGLCDADGTPKSE